MVQYFLCHLVLFPLLLVFLGQGFGRPDLLAQVAVRPCVLKISAGICASWYSNEANVNFIIQLDIGQ
jgi:hypothetical protein